MRDAGSYHAPLETRDASALMKDSTIETKSIFKETFQFEFKPLITSIRSRQGIFIGTALIFKMSRFSVFRTRTPIAFFILAYVRFALSSPCAFSNSKTAHNTYLLFMTIETVFLVLSTYGTVQSRTREVRT